MPRRTVVDISGESDHIPDVVLDNIYGIALTAGGANVIMQLAKLPVGHGVANSRVRSGRVDLHPIKRLRTTVTYLAVAVLGTNEERLTLRRQIDRVHAQVHSLEDEPVEYDAFDTDLQLWVAACLYRGLEDVIEMVDGQRPTGESRRILYDHGRRLGTTLQVPGDCWPATPEDFDEYWDREVSSIEMDDHTRRYLQGIADLSFTVPALGPLQTPLRAALRPVGRFMTMGWLDEPFRAELGIPVDRRMIAAHRLLFGTAGRLSKRLPRTIRLAPLNLTLADARRRMRVERSIL